MLNQRLNIIELVMKCFLVVAVPDNDSYVANCNWSPANIRF